MSPLKDFISLLKVIGKTTLILFFKQLPQTLLWILGTLVLHTYILVYLNNGFNMDSSWWYILSTPNNYINGGIFWMMAVFIIQGVWRLIRGEESPSLLERIKVIKQYFNKAVQDAWAVLLGGIGFSLLSGTILSTYTSAVTAIGIATFLTLRSGRVISLLLSSIWGAIFQTLRKVDISSYSLAVGYLSLGATGLGFLLKYMFIGNFMMIGGVLIIISIFLIAKEKKLDSINTLLLIVGVSLIAIDTMPLLADDGGWQEAGGTFSSWWNSWGSTKAILSGVPASIGAGVGSLINSVLDSVDDNLPNTKANSNPISSSSSNEDTEVKNNSSKSNQVKNPSSLTNIYIGKDGNTYSSIYKDPDTGEPLGVQDGRYEGGHIGDLWYNNHWISPAEFKKILAKRAKEEQIAEEKARREFEEWVKRIDEEEAKEEERKRIEKARQEALKQERERLQYFSSSIRKKLSDSEWDRVQDLLKENRFDEAKKIMGRELKWRKDLASSEANFQTERAKGFDKAVKTTETIRDSSKTAVSLMGGTVASSIASGTIGAVQEASKAFVNGESAGKVISKGVAGFATTATQTAVGHMVQKPGVSITKKIIIPATVDGVSTYVKTGNYKQSLESGLVSGISSSIGGLGSKIHNNILREGTELVSNATLAGAVNYAHGGSFKEGFTEGLRSYSANRLGGVLGTKLGSMAKPVDHDIDIKRTIGEQEELAKQRLSQEELPKNIQKAYEKGKVSIKDALDQMGDTQSSRALKRAPKEIQEAFAKKREEIYKASDEAMIKDVKNRIKQELENSKNIINKDGKNTLGLAEWMRKNGIPEDSELKVDTFSTPGQEGSRIGADRDARLVAVVHSVDKDGNQISHKVEIPRKYWESDAYKHFYKRAEDIYGKEKMNDILQNDPIYKRKYDEMKYLVGTKAPDGHILTEEEIKHRAFAESKQQLYTDKSHIEASSANSDQTTRYERDKSGKVQVIKEQKEPNIVEAKSGKAPLEDEQGYSHMWEAKIRAHEGNTPEMIAQGQKMIKEWIGIRDGQRLRGIQTKEINPNYQKAMKIILQSPTDHKATPEVIENINNQLRSITNSDGKPIFKNVKDALYKMSAGLDYEKLTNRQIGSTNVDNISSGSTILKIVDDIYSKKSNK